jgi:GNAT superfamily N-acetyltransferase
MTILVAVGDRDAIVGTIAFAQHGAEGHLRGMAVIPRLHGEGIADRLLAAAESELRVRGCSTITLDSTEPLQRAIAFYTRHRYVPSGTVTDFFGMRLFEYCKQLS